MTFVKKRPKGIGKLLFAYLVSFCNVIREEIEHFLLIFIKTSISETHTIESSRIPCVYSETIVPICYCYEWKGMFVYFMMIILT